MTNEELVSLIQSGVNVKENLAALYEQNKNFIFTVILPYIRSLGTSKGENLSKPTTVLEVEDLEQEAYFGLVTAAERYDPGQDCLFLTYAKYLIRHKVSRYVHTNGHTKRMPIHLVSLMSRYHKIRIDYEKLHGEAPSDDIYLEQLEISKRRLTTLRYAIQNWSCVSLNDLLPGADDITIGDSIADSYNLEEDITNTLSIEQDSAAIWACVDDLDERQRTVIYSRYMRNMSLSAVAKQERVTGERIRQVERQAFLFLKNKKRLKAIAAQWGFDCYQSFHSGLQRFKDSGMSSVEQIVFNRMSVEEQLAENEARHEREHAEMLERLRLLRESTPSIYQKVSADNG